MVKSISQLALMVDLTLDNTYNKCLSVSPGTILLKPYFSKGDTSLFPGGTNLVSLLANQTPY